MNIKIHARQRGAVLLVSLIMLLLLTVIGTAAMNLSSLDTKMNANARDRQVAFKAAESGLVAAEALVSDGENLPRTNVTAGYASTAITTDQWWNDTAIWATNSVSVSDYAGEQDPSFVIEIPEEGDVDAGAAVSGSVQVTSGEIQPKILYYRTTSNAAGRGGSEVTVQSVYAVKTDTPPL